MMKDGANAKLKNDLKNIQLKYSERESWIEEYFREKGFEQFYTNTNIEVNDFDLIIGDSTYDATNAIIVHSAMKNLLPIQAREEKIWVYYSHTKCWKYMQERWRIKHIEGEENSRIRSRYFFQGESDRKIKVGTVPYVRNGISRLWWAGHIVYDENLDNPYEYINELFSSQDLFVGICEREISKSKKLTISILKAVRKYNLSSLEKNTKLMREILKDINFSAGLVIYDALDSTTIEEKIDEIVEKNLEKAKIAQEV